MTQTLVVVCSRCGGLLLAKAEQKTRTCPYCGAKVELEKAKTVASAPNAYEASDILRKLKNEAMSKRQGARRQSRL
jgi:DNA-directed RNA polymerase subunit RPC12/RpoP